MGEANLHFVPSFCHTVDGRNPAPPWMAETLEIMGCLPSVNWCSISSIHSMFIGFHRQNPLFFPFSLGFPRSRSTFSPYVPRFSEAKSHPHPFPVAHRRGAAVPLQLAFGLEAQRAELLDARLDVRGIGGLEAGKK